MPAETGLAIISGTGDLPHMLADECRRTGRPYQVVVFDGTQLDWLEGHPVVAQPIEKVGKLLKTLKNAGCDSVCFAGKIERPHVNPIKLDMLGMKLASALLTGKSLGDDAILREIIRIFEEHDFTVEGAHEVLPSLLPQAAVLGAIQPDEMALTDVARAEELIAALGQLDVGQGAVVDRGLCLGLETLQGTESMLEYVATSRKPRDRARGVFVKAPKPMQDRRVDLPAIGKETIQQVQAAGLAGIAIAAGGVMVLELEKTIAEANAAGVFLWCKAP